MVPAADSTHELLARWHAGDPAALPALVEAHLPWLREFTAKRLGEFLRAREDAEDYLQTVVLEFLRDGPRFQVRDAAQFRALLARVVENTLRDRHDWYRAKRRDLGRGAPLPSESVLALDPALVTSATPSRDAARGELREWVRLGLELLPAEDRRLLVAREFENRSFVEIGEELGMTANAVRMRWTRAVGRLADVMRSLRAGRMPEPEDEVGGGEVPRPS
jgi:RNA polymerase sigma-70 factor (ECF subfamily)